MSNPEAIKNQFFIVNETDKPCRRLVAEKREDGLLYYIFESSSFLHAHPMSADRATPLEDFGFVVYYNDEEKYYQFEKVNRETAQYPDGAKRSWQDSNCLFQYHLPKIKDERYMVFIEGKSPPKKIHNTKATAKAEAERLLKSDFSAAKAYVVKVESIIEREISTKVTYEIK